MKKFGKAAAMSALVLVLGGCWESRAPLVTEAEADIPGFAAQYEYGGKPLTFRVEGKTFERINGDDVNSDIRFDFVQDRWYLVQDSTPSGGTTNTQYAFMYIRENGDLAQYNPTCDLKTRRLAGVEWISGGSTGGETCLFSNYAALKKASLAYTSDLITQEPGTIYKKTR